MLYLVVYLFDIYRGILFELLAIAITLAIGVFFIVEGLITFDGMA